MQAIYFIAIFGFMSAIIGGIIALSNITTQKLRLMLIAETKTELVTAADLLNKQYVAQNLQSPPMGGPAVVDVGPYLCKTTEVRQIIDCSTGTARDPWHQNITGKAIRETRILMTVNGLMFRVPITTYAVMSPGADGIIATTIPANPTASTQLTALTASGDDILYVFSDFPGQQHTLQTIENATTRIGLAAQRLYEQQFRVIKPSLQTIYTNPGLNGYDLGSAVMQNAWKVYSDSAHWPPAPPGDPTAYTNALNAYRPYLNASNAPNFLKIFPGGTFNSYALGSDGEVALVEHPLVDGSHMTLQASVTDSDPLHYGVNDLLMMTVNTGATPWQQAVAPNCSATSQVNCVRVKGTI